MELARQAAEQRAADRRRAAESFQLGEAGGSRAILGWVAAGVGEAEDGPQGEAQVRDGEMTLEVLVVVRTADGLVVPPWVEAHGGSWCPPIWPSTTVRPVSSPRARCGCRCR